VINVVVYYASDRKIMGTYEFREVPRIGEHIRIPNPNPFEPWEIYKVSAVVHMGLETKRSKCAMPEPSLIQIYCEYWGEDE
jgi:hypothetical protein